MKHALFVQNVAPHSWINSLVQKLIESTVGPVMMPSLPLAAMDATMFSEQVCFIDRQYHNCIWHYVHRQLYDKIGQGLHQHFLNCRHEKNGIQDSTMA